MRYWLRDNSMFPWHSDKAGRCIGSYCSGMVLLGDISSNCCLSRKMGADGVYIEKPFWIFSVIAISFASSLFFSAWWTLIHAILSQFISVFWKKIQFGYCVGTVLRKMWKIILFQYTIIIIMSSQYMLRCIFATCTPHD